MKLLSGCSLRKVTKQQGEVPESPSEKQNSSPLQHGSVALELPPSPAKLSKVDTRWRPG